MIRDLESKIVYLEDLLQRVASEILANVLYEKTSPSDLWANSAEIINAIRKVSEEIKEGMLILKPDRAPSIKRAFRAFAQPINMFEETLKKPTESPYSSSKQALEQLRKAVTGSQEFIEMAKEVAKNPSRYILEILKLKEVYEAKEYISKVSVPDAVFARLEFLNKNMEILKHRISNLEQAVQELLRQIDRVQEEISKFQRSRQET
ncbi:hypothetical protein J7L29_02570 [Candidatus Bathyarchaeota archaeon]|nr:hypothetical protein [Candidatus Bathyarchaeota archaeon]